MKNNFISIARITRSFCVLSQEFISKIEALHVCPTPARSSCSKVAPAMDELGICFYMDTTCVVNETNPCTEQPNDWWCGSKKSSVRRFCSCMTNNRKHHRRSNVLLASEASNSTSSGCHVHSSTFVSGLAAAISVLSFMGPNSLHVSPTGSRLRISKSLFACVVFITCLWNQHPVAAHNWVITRARALTEASTTSPCRSRKASDTHAQVGPNQSFVVKWASGHSNPSFWVVVHERDEHWLRDKSFVSYVNDYIANAPPPRCEQEYGPISSALSRCAPKLVPKLFDAQGKWRGGRVRRPGTSTRQSLSFVKLSIVLLHLQCTIQHQYKEIYLFLQVLPSDPNFLTNARAPTKYLWRFNEEVLSHDKHVSYQSEKYPWIEAAYKYRFPRSCFLLRIGVSNSYSLPCYTQNAYGTHNYCAMTREMHLAYTNVTLPRTTYVGICMQHTVPATTMLSG